MGLRQSCAEGVASWVYRALRISYFASARILRNK